MTDGYEPPVSRETAVAALFGERAPLIEDYADFLVTAGVERGMIGPREAPRLWERHLLNCAVVAPRLPASASVADVGTGAGLPGLVWAIARPDVGMTLIEPLLRRTRFLEEAIERLGLTNVRVERARAEDVREEFDVVTARAVAPLEKLARWCLPLVSAGGVLAALKGNSAADEVERARGTLRRLGARGVALVTYGEDILEVPTTVVEVSR